MVVEGSSNCEQYKETELRFVVIKIVCVHTAVYARVCIDTCEVGLFICVHTEPRLCNQASSFLLILSLEAGSLL